jgi:hypothetical protein
LNSSLPQSYRHLIRGVLGCTVPVLLMTLYLLLTRRYGGSFDWDWWALVGSCLVGWILIVTLKSPLRRKVLLSLLYLPIMGTFLFFYTFAFVCSAFQNCL